MSYPNFFDPTPWDETKHEAFKQTIVDGAANQSPEVRAAWGQIADKLIEIADLFRSVSTTGIPQVVMTADNDAVKGKQVLNFVIKERRI